MRGRDWTGPMDEGNRLTNHCLYRERPFSKQERKGLEQAKKRKGLEQAQESKKSDDG